MEYFHVAMILDNLESLPRHAPPAGYRFVMYGDGNETAWAEVETSAGEFKTQDTALEHFSREFGDFRNEMKERCVFLATDSGRIVGTATAWYNREFKDGRYGRLHWVGIHQDYQGKGLGKLLVGKAMQVLAQYHAKAYLTTQTTSAIAIKIYLDFGFVPYHVRETCPKAWRLLAEALKHPALNVYLSAGT